MGKTSGLGVEVALGLDALTAELLDSCLIMTLRKTETLFQAWCVLRIVAFTSL